MKTSMQKEDLLRKHLYHKKFSQAWETYLKMKQSGDELVDYAIYQQPRETYKNFEARRRDAIVYNLAKTVIDIFSFYMSEKETVYSIPGLENDTQWRMFIDDADLQGTNYSVLMNEAQKYSSYFGAVGMLVNRPFSDGTTLQDEIDKGVYPYYTMYSLPNIFDWQYMKDPVTHRKILVYLKLYEEDGTWTIWTPGSWEQWSIHPKRGVAVLTAKGINPLGEIPFTWMVNIRNMEYPEVGQSDIVDIARIVLSIAQNMSSADEIIKYAGFPIMRIPMKRQDILSPKIDEEVDTGPTATSEFDPSLGKDGKADWMPTQIKEPIDAILSVVEGKCNEVYRIAYLSGIHGQRKSGNEATSGLALRYEFSQLNSVLINKTINKIEAELTLLYYWLKWKNMSEIFDNVEIKGSKEFSIDELAVTLDNAIIAYKAVLSKTFREEIQKKIANRTLSDLPQEKKTKIISEIEENTPEECTFDVKVTNRALVKSAANAANQKPGDPSPSPENKGTN